MLSSKDIQNLSEYLLEIFKDTFATKGDLALIDTKIDKLLSSMDNFAKNDGRNSDEITAAGNRIENLENWAKKVGAKTNIPLEN